MHCASAFLVGLSDIMLSDVGTLMSESDHNASNKSGHMSSLSSIGPITQDHLSLCGR